MISIKKLDSNTYEVTVEERTKTVHRVTLSDEFYEELTGGALTPEALIEKSFEFLLKRESNTSILSSFDLREIGRYFPEYQRAMKKALS